MYPLGGGPSPKKIWGAKFFPNPLGSGGVVQNFFGNSFWKEVPKTGFKNLGVPQRNLRGVKISPHFAIFRLFRPFLQNGARYRKSKNWFVIYGHSSTGWWRNGVLLSSMNYVMWTRTHPPSDLFKLALLGGQGSHLLQIFTSGSGSWCLTYVPLGGPPPQKKLGGAKFFPTPLGSGVWSKLFLVDNWITDCIWLVACLGMSSITAVSSI